MSQKPSERHDTQPKERALPRGWSWTTLGDICEPAEKANPAANPDVEFTYIDIAAINNDSLKIVEPKRYRGADAPSRARQIIQAGDILFSTVRTYLKNIAQVPREYDGEIASTGFAVIRPYQEIDSKFVFGVNPIFRTVPIVNFRPSGHVALRILPEVDILDSNVDVLCCRPPL
jgi:type I restriction enzyme S subunit